MTDHAFDPDFDNLALERLLGEGCPHDGEAGWRSAASPSLPFAPESPLTPRLDPDGPPGRASRPGATYWSDPDRPRPPAPPALPAVPLDHRHAPDRKEAPPKTARPKRPRRDAPHDDPRPVTAREHPILMTEEDLVGLVEKTLGVQVPHADGGLLLLLTDRALSAVLAMGSKNPYHDAGEAMQELAVALLSRKGGEPVRDVIGYLCESVRRVASAAVNRSRCVSRLRDRDGNRRYVSRRREITSAVEASLVGDADALYLERLAERAFEALPEPDRGLYRDYLRLGSRSRFMQERRDDLAPLGIDTEHKLSHWVRGVRERLRSFDGLPD